MEGSYTKECETIDISKMDLSGKEEECTKEKEEEDGPREVGIVHYVLVYPRQWVQDC